MSTPEHWTPEHEVAATIDAVRREPNRRDELVDLLPEDVPLYEGRTSAEVTRIRGYLLAAFADTGLPAPALPYVLEVLESGHMPYEIAGAAIGLRGIDRPTAGVSRYLLQAVRNLSGADGTVSFEGYDPRWPYARPTTALTEVLRTVGCLGAEAAMALPDLERLLAPRERYAASVLAELQCVREAVRSAPAGCHGRSEGRGGKQDATRSCCAHVARGEPSEAHTRDALSRALDVGLEDQDGRVESFAGYFRDKPSVVAFFYTRCDNPYKCSLTVTKLAQLQGLIRDRGLAGALRLAAITYDPSFDIPKRLKLYGNERGVTFEEDLRFFRTTSGFGELSGHFQLRVNYGPSTVNRHQIEAFLLDARGGVADSFTRSQWEPEEVLASAEPLLVQMR